MDGKKERKPRKKKKCERCKKYEACRNNGYVYCHFCASTAFLGEDYARSLGILLPPAAPAQQELFEEIEGESTDGQMD